MLRAIQIIRQLEDFYSTSIEIEVFGVDSTSDLDEVIDTEIDTWADLYKPIIELEILAHKASDNYIWSRDNLDRLQECICRWKSIHFLKDLNTTLKNFDIILFDY